MKRSQWLERALYMWPIKILSVAAAILLFFFTRLASLETRPISLPIHYILPSGYTQAQEYPVSARVQLRGEGIYDLKEEDLRIVADLSQHTTEGTFRITLAPVKLGIAIDMKTLEITVEPEYVTINMERIVFKEVPVSLQLTGEAKAGSELLSYSITPSMVRISGPRSRIPLIQTVHTEDVDLSARDADFTQRVRLRSPDPLVRMASTEVVELRAEIREAMRAGVFESVPIVVVGLPEGLTTAATLGTGTIRLQGFLQQLETLDSGQLRMLIDASAMNAEGVYTAKIIPEVPAEFIILSYEPKAIELSVLPVDKETSAPPSPGATPPSQVQPGATPVLNPRGQ